MAKYNLEQEVHVPSFFTRDMSDTDKASFEETYKACAWMLRIIRGRLESHRDALAKDSEELLNHEEFLKNAATRQAYRTLIDYLPNN